jgi:hypothetical protein
LGGQVCIIVENGLARPVLRRHGSKIPRRLGKGMKMMLAFFGYETLN